MAPRKRIIPKRQLEIKLSKLESFKTPQLRLEQYAVSAEAASELLYMAGFEHDDLHGKIIDLGTGTGTLAIGAALMKANDVTGLDIDGRSIRTAAQNAKGLHVKVDWVVGDLESVHGKFQTVLMNPPYGTRLPHLDTHFLSKALQLAPVSYSIHKRSTRQFLTSFVAKRGGRVDEVRALEMSIPHMFDFHRKKWETVHVDILRVSKLE